MTERITVVSRAEIDEQNEALYRQHRQAEADKVSTDEAFVAVANAFNPPYKDQAERIRIQNEIVRAYVPAVQARRVGRQILEASEAFYKTHKGVLYDLAKQEDTKRTPKTIKV